MAVEEESAELEEDEEDLQRSRLLSVIDEIRDFDSQVEALHEARDVETISAEELEKIESEQNDLKAKMAEVLKSLRLKDRHIEKIAQRLKELSLKVDRVNADVADLEKEAGFSSEELLLIFAGMVKGKMEEKRALKKLGISLEEAQKTEKRLKSMGKKIRKIEQESGFHASGLSRAIQAIEDGESQATSAKSEVVEPNLRLVV